MTTSLQPQEHAGALQRAEWCLGLAEATITTLTDAAFVGRAVRPLSADGLGPEVPPPQGARGAGRSRRHLGGHRRRPQS